MPSLTWLTRDDDVKRAGTVPYRLLEADPALSHGDPAAGNMLIQGDNLDALKALLPYYKGRVKCIYIDPPFNTGGAFPNYDDNMEHTVWLSLMYGRLVLLHSLLATDGSIMVNLDDHQSAYVKVMMDEIFGRKNYIVTITVEAATASSFKTVNTGPTEVSQFITLFAKNKEKFLYNSQFIYSKNVDLQHFSRFVENFDESPEIWRFKNIKQSVMDDLGVPPADHPAARYRLASQHLGEGYSEIVEAKANAFALENAYRVFEPKTLQKPAAWLVPHIELSKNQHSPISLERPAYDRLILLKGRQMYFLSGSVRQHAGKNYVAKPLTTIWTDIPTNNLKSEGGVDFPGGKKPEMLIQRVISMTTQTNDIILDSFLGSGTTAAVAHKMGRRWIGIEMGEQAVTHCAPRLTMVIDGEQGGISKAVDWQGGGGFTFYRLGESVFDDQGRIRSGIRFPALAAHIWFSESGIPYQGSADTPFLGTHNGRGLALLYNGILGDKRVTGGNVLTNALLQSIRAAAGHNGPLTIYGEASRIGAPRLKAEGVTFKQTPYDVKAR